MAQYYFYVYYDVHCCENVSDVLDSFSGLNILNNKFSR